MKIQLPKDLTEEEYFYLLTLEFRIRQCQYEIDGEFRDDAKKMAMKDVCIAGFMLRHSNTERRHNKGLSPFERLDECALCYLYNKRDANKKPQDCNGCPATKRKYGGDGYCDHWIDSVSNYYHNDWKIEALQSKAKRLRKVIRDRRNKK